MGLVQVLITYAICWWMVLFMVLPFGVTPEASPVPGHAPSAPAKPRLRHKFIITSLITIIPTALIYFAAGEAKADDTIYHVGGSGECEGLPAYKTPEGVNVAAGEGTKGKKVAPADLQPNPLAEQFSTVDIPIKIPTGNYISSESYNADMSESFIEAGTLSVGQDGDIKMNGRLINDSAILSDKCKEKGQIK